MAPLLFLFIAPTLIQVTGLALGFLAVGLPAWIAPVGVVALYVLPLMPVGPTLHRTLWALSVLGYVAGLVRGT